MGKNEQILIEARIHLINHFFYHKRLTHAGKHEAEGLTFYLYEDVDLAVEEQKIFYIYCQILN